jgi:hypothetical protein
MEECPWCHRQMNNSSQIFDMQWCKAHLLELPYSIGFILDSRLGSRPRFPLMKSTYFGYFFALHKWLVVFVCTLSACDGAWFNIIRVITYPILYHGNCWPMINYQVPWLWLCKSQ